ncbi:MAG: GNAT family N-acetyltransferase [Deltaproteobacteria bacterium]|nr:GNAT family N-acetyltransferase [Deltaproteobacteria bacterium]
MKIRKAEEKDISALSKLHKEFIQEHAQLYDRVFYEVTRHATKQWTQWAKKMLQNKSIGFFIAEEKDEIIGYVSGWIEERPPIYSLKKTGYLSNIFIIPQKRKKGIGSNLHEALLGWFKKKKVTYVELNVNTQATPAYAAWSALGYKEVAKRMRRIV